MNYQNLNPTPPDTGSWTPWPDGNFSYDLSNDQARATKNAMVHWATGTSGGLGGDPKANEWFRGKKSIRKCLGIIVCTDPSCHIRIRPVVRADSAERQLERPCDCGSPLVRHSCDARLIMHEWRGGKHFEHRGHHLHERPHPLHLNTSEAETLQQIVAEHPKASPSKLITGIPTLYGNTQPVSEISTTLFNPDRVKYEVSKIRRGVNPQSGDGFIEKFTAFWNEHPGFLIRSIMGDIVVLSMQSQVLAGDFLKELIPNEAINGIVSDAAHGYWLDNNALLIVSSTYSPVLSAWVPGVFTYSNGASATHYMHHFLALFSVISEEAHRRDLDLCDDYFANVRFIIDFPYGMFPITCPLSLIGC